MAALWALLVPPPTLLLKLSLVELVLSQKHVESYHSELAQQLGYKPAPRMLEPRACRVTPRLEPPHALSHPLP